MPPRLHVCARCLRASRQSLRTSSNPRSYASLQAIAPAPSIEQMTTSIPPIARYPSTQPPSHRPPEFRKSQLHRQYTSLLRSTPLMLLFQHNNLKAVEWMGIRRELAFALRKVDESRNTAASSAEELADGVKVQIIQTGIFAAALRVVEYYDPNLQPKPRTAYPSDPATQTSTVLANTLPDPNDPSHRHALSRAAHDAVLHKRLSHALTPLLSGPLAVVSFPAVSTEHLKATLSILAPKAPNFPAPTRRANPGYHDLAVQTGLQKLLLLGARVEGKVFDTDGVRWVGTIEGGLDGLRGQLAALLQSFGAGITTTLESAGKSLYITMESRRTMLEDKEKEGKSGSE
ncbi:hypothetical protein MMC13_008281 [Lambiella insularis]|nr:hypothetical protein [Lambiella insularis]